MMRGVDEAMLFASAYFPLTALSKKEEGEHKV
jgi:hypothetical protein